MRLKIITSLLLLLTLSIPTVGINQTLFTQPSMTFINTPSEKITDLSLSNISIDSVNSVINKTRLTYPNNIIRVTLSGNFIVVANPISLTNKMLLLLNNATLLANSNTTATSFISISNDTMVSVGIINNGILNGDNNNIIGINVTNSGKTHIDGLTIQNCKNGGIYYIGRGANTYADAGSITRCTINNCGSIGISYNNSFNFICTDNAITNNTVGIHINGNNSLVSNNVVKNCTTGMESVSGNEAITYNNIDTCKTGISLTSVSSQTLVAYNNILFNTIGLNCKGTKAIVFYNNFNNTQQVTSNGIYTQLYNNLGINTTQGNLKGCTYFNPPTIGNPHKDLIKVGESRFDIIIKDTLLTAIRGILDSLHNLYPNTVLVAHLNGTFNALTINDSLIINDDECILLNGIINGTDSCGKLISFADGCTSSFSGGIINGNKLDGKTALVYITATSNVIMDSVILKNSYGQGIEKKSSTSSTFIRACSLDSINGRCIWDVSSSKLFAFENKTSNGRNDGIDLDAGSSYCVLQYNKCINNKRNGIFIEEGAKNHIVIGNTLKNNVCGLEFYNLAVNNQNSSRNLVANNICTANNRGILVSAATTTKASTDNVIFNNICSNNTDVGIGGFYNGTNTFNNYTALNTMSNNTNGPFYSIANFTNNYVWNLIANPKTLPIDFILFEGKESGKGIELNWALSISQILTQFEIERSNNGIDFNTIGYSPISFGNSYNFEDTKPLNGINFYRIKLIDNEGRNYYSKVISLQNNPITVKCYVLSDGIININATDTESFHKIGIIIYDLVGNIIYDYAFDQINSKEFIRQIKVPIIKKGIYIIAINMDKREWITKVML